MSHAMSLTLPTCAFCAPLALPTTRSLSLSSTSISIRHHRPRPSFRAYPSPSQPLPSPTHPPKRQRSHTPPMAVRNNSNDKVKAQIADVLLSAGRFLQSPTGQLFLWVGLIWLVLTGRIGVLFDSFLVLFAVVSIVPVLAIVGFRWWINRQLVQGTCPSCGAPVTGIRNQAFQCMTCGNSVQVEKGDFSVKDPSSATIDIDAKEIDDF